MGRIAASEVPLARCWPRRAHMTWSGTITNPPPRPSRPPAKPAIPPMAASTRRSAARGVPISYSREPADVEIHHLFIIQQVQARPLQSVLPEHQDVCPLGMPQRLAGVLLDDEHGDAGGADLLDAFPDQALELRCKAGTRFIEDEHGGIDHQASGQREHGPLASTQ